MSFGKELQIYFKNCIDFSILFDTHQSLFQKAKKKNASRPWLTRSWCFDTEQDIISRRKKRRKERERMVKTGLSEAQV